ncbi:MAG: cytochrome-c oxidase, cbb3-type subunit III [Alphaproteobacteria bacterium]|nr:cytochrome-c oxidase, cbb3-type subunit III [Alphaproteobacteria bacterium]
MPTKIEKDAYTGIDTTGHEWDGITELNRPLPRWWLYVLYATIIWSFGYYVAYPSIPGITGHTPGVLGWTMREQIRDDLAAARADQAQFRSAIEERSLAEIRQDPDLLNFALAGGRAAFADNCAPCHGTAALGGKGYPSLADDDWLWGGTLESIHITLLHGIRYAQNEETRQNEMPRFGVDELLTSDQIDDVVEHVLSYTGRSEDAAAAARGAEIYTEQCASCHGEQGEGNMELGAPSLRDEVWLYGGERAEITESVAYSRAGVMPAWSHRLDASTIKMLTVYVHSLGGGQ